MKILQRLLIIALCILIPGSAMTWGPVMSGGVASAGTTYNWTNIKFFLNFEANDTTGDYNMATTSCGTACEYSAGDTSGAYGSGTNLATGGTVGTYVLNCNAEWENMSFSVTDGTELRAAQGSVGIWTRFSTTEAMRPITIDNTVSGANIRIATDGTHWQIYVNNNYDMLATYTSTATYSTNTWYFVNLLWNTVTNSFTLYVDNASVATGTGIMGSVTFNRIIIGTAYSGTALIDSVIISNTAENLYAWRTATGYGQ